VRATPAELRAQGRCTKCRCDITALVGWSGVRCPECREENRERLRRDWNTKAGRARRLRWSRKRYQRRAEDMREAARKRREEHKLAGLCVWCKEPACEDCNLCVACRDMQRESARKSVEKRRQALIAAGLCSRCGGDRDRESQVCSKCRAYLTNLTRHKKAKDRRAMEAA
jgi:hypothetical protein